MRFHFRLIHGLEDAQANFEQIETAFGLPVFAAAPPPFPGRVYFDSTLGQLGYFNATTWVYL